MDSQLYILGAGRHPKTKMLRAQRGHRRRTFYIGELHIQSNKRLPISVEWAGRHFDAIVRHIKDGTVLLHFARDKFVDPEELRTLCFGTPEEAAEYAAKANKNPPGENTPSTDPGDPASTDPGAGDVGEPGLSDPEASIPQGPSAEELEKVAERGSEAPVDLADEPVAPPEAPAEALAEETAPELPPEAPVAPEDVVETPEAPAEPEKEPEEPAAEETPAAEEAPVADVAPEIPPPPEETLESPAEPAAKLELPEDWKRKSKSSLLGYADALGLDTSSMPSNKQLIAMIEKATEK